MWRPTTIEELEAIVAKQLATCSPEQQQAFAAHRVPFYSVPIHGHGATEQVLVVAEFSGSVLYFEDIEEGFEMSGLGQDGAIPERGCNQFELGHVLSRFGVQPAVPADA